MKRTLIFSLLVLSACRADSNLPGPDEGGGAASVSIAYLKTLYNGAPLPITDELRIEGRVVSNDREGNFYHTLVVEDDTGGIEIRMELDEIFKRFRFHSRTRVRCNGLWLGSYGGTLQLGAAPFEGYETTALDEIEIAEHIGSDNTFYGEITPTVLPVDGPALRHISTFVAFEGVRFVEQCESWADTSEDAPGATDRYITDGQGNTLAVRTSRYARFASWPLPEGTGRIEGVLGYFNGEYQLVVTDSQRFVAH